MKRDESQESMLPPADLNQKSNSPTLINRLKTLTIVRSAEGPDAKVVLFIFVVDFCLEVIIKLTLRTIHIEILDAR